MNVSSKIKQSTETKNEVNNIVMTDEDASVLTNVNMPFSEFLSGQISEENQNGISSGLSLMNIDFNYDSLSMGLEDAMFFVNLTKEGQFTVNTSQNGDFQSILQLDVSQNSVSSKTVEVTNQLTTLIEKAQSTQKPVRISFDNDVSVILKIDKHGKITAEFIPGSIEVENYLRNNIASLKQKFDEQNLPYNDLLYRQSGRQNKNKNKERGEQ